MVDHYKRYIMEVNTKLTTKSYNLLRVSSRRTLASLIPSEDTVRLYEGQEYIYRPSIGRLKEGMMVRALPHSGTSRQFGTIVAKVDVELKRVLIGDSIGGTKETWQWVDVADLIVAWDIGSFEYAMALIKAFDGAMYSLVGEKPPSSTERIN